MEDCRANGEELLMYSQFCYPSRCSQYEFEEWYDQLDGDASSLTDAIINRTGIFKTYEEDVLELY